ncbi:metal-dependent hydrolase [Aurantiacibacter spongiae]|uniref:Metal-dependent hydrolase n=1 Tax=Aurantiacibacter spongiae TaxID=2488860 RepID=A0A3N5CPB0_9SPHN|nr:metal-dependent hydrolase [Aurantiacibacter spongiae]RPF70823.1 metal-dependent hydrolase [Aurantiacibacter spongiae]
MTTATTTPPITVRDRRFGRNGSRDLAVQRGKARSTTDIVGTAFFTALSLSFPRGEAMFIEAVKAHREGTPERLREEIRLFIRQEVNHSREHLVFNRMAAEAGYDTATIDARVERLVQQVYDQPAIVQLAITMALEHFTAMFAHEFLANPDSIATDAMEDRALWLWHAAEEIEHKGVAYDTWLHATRDWSAFKRWSVRSLIMLRTSVRFLKNRSQDALALLEQDGLTGWRAKAALLRYLVARPGLLRRVFPAWLAFFRPGFHPWDVDDRALIAGYDEGFARSGFADARMEPAAS